MKKYDNMIYLKIIWYFLNLNLYHNEEDKQDKLTRATKWFETAIFKSYDPNRGAHVITITQHS